MSPKKPKILIVEDESLTSSMYADFIEFCDCGDHRIVTTGRGAIEAANEYGPDIIFMDIRLADDIDGIEAAKAIHLSKDIPVVFMSAYCDEEIMRRAREAGAAGFLTKPFSLENIRFYAEAANFPRSD